MRIDYGKTPVRCGACDAKFSTARELAEHLKVCQFAKVGVSMLKQALDAGLEPDINAQEN